MKKKLFDSAKFVNDIGKDLVRDFEKARQATTPELIGDAMEQPVKDRLEQILPQGIAVGSGCVIDSKGNSSRQIDIILYERDICPVFCINNSPETTYYPCEGVIAVGEVKSTIGKAKLEDSFNKIKSVKSLIRNFDKPKLPAYEGRKVYDYRKYGQTTTVNPIRLDFIPTEDEFSDIFGFILAGNMETQRTTLFKNYVDLMNNMEDNICPNMTVSLSGEVFFPSKLWKQNEKRVADMVLSTRTANSITCQKLSCPFSILICWLFDAYYSGKTSSIQVFNEYFLEKESSEIVETLFIKGRTELKQKPIVKGLL